MSKRDMLSEAIAEAKIVKETAYENAKAALTETFAPHLKSMLSAKLQEMETEEEVEETFMPEEEMDETIYENEEIDEETDLDELLKEIEGEDELDETKKEDEAEEAETEEDETTPETEEELNIEDLSEEDLKGFIEDVINDMIESGELEAGEEHEEDETKEEEAEEHEGDEEVDLDNIENDETEEVDEMLSLESLEDESVENEELEEAYRTIESLRTTISEIKVLNAKLLYTNKLFKEKTLTEGKKLQVLHAFEKTKTVKEAKTVYGILKESLNNKEEIRKPFKGAASKTMSPINEHRQPIIEVNDQYNRWQILAGIKTNN